MIEIEIKHSPDPLSIGHVRFEFDEITIGGTNKSQLCIDDENVLSCHIRLSLKKMILYCETIEPTPFFHLNGHKVTGKISTKPNDVIKIGSTEITIISFQTTQTYDFNADLSERMNAFENSAPESYKKMLKQIENQIIKLES